MEEGVGVNEISVSSAMPKFYAIHGGRRRGCKGKEKRKKKKKKKTVANASAMHKVIKLSSSNSQTTQCMWEGGQLGGSTHASNVLLVKIQNTNKLCRRKRRNN